ncbi:insulinase family protein [bacterium]|nr:insulinase family protein [bacterium]
MIQKIPVIEYKKDFSYAEITLCFPGGSSLEDDKTLGFAHFCEHLAFKLKVDGVSIFEFVSALGGSSNAYTSHDVIAFEIMVQSRYVAEVIAFLEKIFNTSFMTIDDADFTEERRVVLEEMAMYDDNPADNLHETLMHNIYTKHTYGQKILGENFTVGKAEKKAVADFWKNRVFNSPYLVIAGGYDKTPSMELDVSPDWKKGKLTPWKGTRRFEITNRQNKCYFAAGWDLPPHTGRIEAMMNLISAITYSMDSGVLYNELVYEHNTFDTYTEGTETGVFGSTYVQLCAMPASNVKKRIEKWAKVWDSLEFTQSQVAKAREVLLSKEFFNSEGLGNTPAIMQKSFLLYKDAEKLDRDYFYEFVHLTADDLNRFKREYLGFDKVFIGFSKSPKCTFDIDSFEFPAAKSVDRNKDHAAIKSGKLKCFVKKLDGSPFVSGCILKRGGAQMNLKGFPGSFKLAVSSIFASADGMTFDETNSYLDKFGIRIKPVNSNSYAGLEFTARDSFADEAVDIVKRFFDNKIKEEDFEKEKLSVLSNLSMMQEYPEYFIRAAANRELFGGTPWEYISDGTVESVSKMTINDARKIREIFLNKNDFVMAIAGAAETKTAEKLLSCFKEGKSPLETVPAKLKPLSGETIKIPVKGRDQAYISKIFRGPSHYDKDFDTMRLLECYMNGERSPLFTELREKSGLVYTFSFLISNTPVGGAANFIAITSPEKIQAVQQVFEKAIDDIRNGKLLEERLNETKNTLATSFAKAVQSSSFHSSNIVIEEVLSLKAGTYLKQLEIINSITPEMIRAAAEKWLKKGTWILSGAV